MSKRVVVTGMGSVNPLANDVQTSWDHIKNSVSGIETITKFDMSDYHVKVAGEVKNFLAKEHMDFKEARRMARFTHFAVAASKMAMQDASAEVGKDIDAERIGVWIGSGIGGLDEFEDQHKKFLSKGPRRVIY